MDDIDERYQILVAYETFNDSIDTRNVGEKRQPSIPIKDSIDTRNVGEKRQSSNPIEDSIATRNVGEKRQSSTPIKGSIVTRNAGERRLSITSRKGSILTRIAGGKCQSITPVEGSVLTRNAASKRQSTVPRKESILTRNGGVKQQSSTPIKDSILTINPGGKRQSTPKEDYIWTKKKNGHSDEDARATEMMLDFMARPKIKVMLFDKKSDKRKLWEDIAQHLMSNGFKISLSPAKAGMKCNQKWKNMKINYIKQIGSKTNTKQNPPYFFKKIHHLLRNKCQATSKLVTEEAEELNVVTSSASADTPQLLSEVPGDKDDSSEVKRAPSPSVSHVKELKNISEQMALCMLQKFEEFRKDEEKRFEVVCRFLKHSKEERDKLTEPLLLHLNRNADPTDRICGSSFKTRRMYNHFDL